MNKILLIAALLFPALSFAVSNSPQIVQLYGADGGAINTTTGAINVSGTISATNPSVSTNGAAVPASGTYVSGSKAGTLTGLLIGQQTMANSLACTLASDQSSIPITSATLALDTSVNGIIVAQGSTTSGQKGSLILGAVTTAAPSYTTAQSSALSLNTAGGLRVDGSGVTQPVSGTVTANLAAGTNLVGKVGIDQTTVGTTNAVSLAQIGAVAVSSGNGVAGTGVQRVTIASDNTAFSVNSNLKDGSGTSVTVGQKTMASSLPVTIASDQVSPKTYANSAGSFVLNAALTTVVSETAPANAVGFILQAKDANAANIRWALGATATTTSGMQLQPGRDTSFVPVAATISIVAESGTLEYQLTWIKQ